MGYNYAHQEPTQIYVHYCSYLTKLRLQPISGQVGVFHTQPVVSLHHVQENSKKICIVISNIKKVY